MMVHVIFFKAAIDLNSVVSIAMKIIFLWTNIVVTTTAVAAAVVIAFVTASAAVAMVPHTSKDES